MYSARLCGACGASYSPTSGQQLVCDILSCQEWLALQRRPGEEDDAVYAVKSRRRLSSVRNRQRTKTSQPTVWESRQASKRQKAREWRASHPDEAREADRQSKGRRKAQNPDAVRLAGRLKRRRQRAANPQKAREDSRNSSALWRQRHPDRVAEESRKRRARIYGAPVVEDVDRFVVAERDGWTCQLCLEEIDPEAPYQMPDGSLNPFYLNVDHIVPLYLGGDHSYANVHATHRQCNLERQYRTVRLSRRMSERDAA